MFELIFLLGLVYWIGSEHGDKVGTIALWILIGALVVGLCRAGKSVNKAYGNFVDYWAEGGPKRRK